MQRGQLVLVLVVVVEVKQRIVLGRRCGPFAESLVNLPVAGLALSVAVVLMFAGSTPFGGLKQVGFAVGARFDLYVWWSRHHSMGALGNTPHFVTSVNHVIKSISLYVMVFNLQVS